MKGLFYRLAASLVPAWLTCADAVGRFIEELAFRMLLAASVLAGRVPVKAERRWWNRATETPVLVDVYDWTNERFIFSVLVWPALEVSPDQASRAQEARSEKVLRVIHAGAAEMAWSTRYEVDYGLKWDAERQVWAASDGFAYDGAHLFDYSRSGAV